MCVKLVTPLDGTVKFLKHLGDLFRNFGIHLRGETGVEVYLCRSANLSTVLQGSLKDVVSDVQLIMKIGSQSHKWTRGHSSQMQQDHVIL